MLKPLKKKLLEAPWTLSAASWLLATYVRLVRRTLRVEERGGVPPAPFVALIWHGRTMVASAIWARRLPISFLISTHRDGRLIGSTVKRLGVDAIDGSTTRGATAGFRSMLRALRGGRCVGLTPDGPRGPRMRVKRGAVDMAWRAGVPIVHAAYSCRRGKHLRSWDRYLVTYPFTRCVLLWGEPIHVPEDADEVERERIAGELERAMIELSAEADRACGREVIEPEPAPATVGG